MSKPFVFEKPIGMRDILPGLFELKQTVRNEMEKVIQSWGYEYLHTPTLEYYDTVGEASSIEEQQLFKLLDQQGKTVVLRPDMTAPIARVTASSLRNEIYPLRLAYSANVFRAQQREGGKPAEFEQFGAELIGDQSISADAEMIALMIESLKSAGLDEFKVAIGNMKFLNTILLEVLGTEERANELKKYLFEKNYVGFKQHVKSLSLSSIDKRRLLDFTNLRGSKQVLQTALNMVTTEEGEQAIHELEELCSILQDYGLSEFIVIDFTLVSHMSYYTGILFEGYAHQLGFPVSNGGRYDDLIQKFGHSRQATGFAVQLDYLLEALSVNAEQPPIHCIVFSKERRNEAIEEAATLRNEGKRVVLQDYKGIADVDGLSNKYETKFFLGKTKAEGIDNG